ncbi:glycosyltransferase family 4 protein [Bacillus carboniphilus]|uniref:Glycosyltransferase family 4 protein n=1 Tax=Bacillus carboniphilus TaxID=86663 RepID=A0ABN0VRP3_9BACI
MDKILYLLNYPGMGGTEKYVVDLIHSLGPEKCVFVYSEEGLGLQTIKDTGVPTYQLSMRGPFDLQAALKLKKIIKDENIKTVHTQFLRENYVALLAKLLGADIRVIWTYHVDVPMNLFVRQGNYLVTKLNHRVIAVSNFMFQQLVKKGIPEKKVKLIYNGVEEPELLPSPNPNEELKISIIGRLREEKGHDFLLKSLAKLDKQYPELPWICNIFGDGPLENELHSLVKKLGLESRVNIKGFTNNKEEIYSQTDIVVIPSSNEALSYVAIEALSYSKVVIASNVGGLPEIVKDGETGILVEYGDVESLTTKLKKILTDQELYQSLAKNGNAFFKEKFTLTKMIKDTISCYKE